MNQAQGSLQSLTEAFAHWRKTRSHIRSPVPQDLRRQVIDLLDQHTASRIVEATGIRYNMLRRWQQDLCPVQTDSAFVALPLLKKGVAPTPDSSITVSLASGQQVTLQGLFSPEQLTALMRGVVEGMEEK
jgi:hypothetical protein